MTVCSIFMLPFYRRFSGLTLLYLIRSCLVLEDISGQIVHAICWILGIPLWLMAQDSRDVLGFLFWYNNGIPGLQSSFLLFYHRY